jgi:hypothetical protein
MVYNTRNVRFEVFTAVTMKNGVFWKLQRVALVRTDVSEELRASIITVTRIAELGTTLVVTSTNFQHSELLGLWTLYIVQNSSELEHKNKLRDP